jgi:DNA repair protein RecN (Recombination protein N)
MLRELRIRDIAIIEDLVVQFGPGLNVLSGETGAGKSIILGALGLVLGGRASAEMVRTGRESAEVQARVDRGPAVDSILRSLDLPVSDEEDGLLLRRVVTAQGRSRAYIGSSAVPIAALRTLAQVLVDYSSQHEHQVLLDEASHLAVLDRFGVLTGLRTTCAVAVAEVRRLLTERDRLAVVEQEQRSREDYLTFQLEELAAANLVEGELEELRSERLLLRHAEERGEAARAAEAALYSGAGAATETLSVAIKKVRRLVEIDPALAPILEGVESAMIAAEEAGRELGDYARSAESDPFRLQEVDDRIALLRRLARKHRCDFGQLVELRDRLQAEMDELGSLDVRLAGLQSDIDAARRSAREVCETLSRKRQAAARRLRKAVEQELGSLAMERACFEVRFEAFVTGADNPGLGEDGGAPWGGTTGIDRVAFQLSANPGEDPKPLVKVASGGELSRILLAIRRSLAGSTVVQTCVFDEVDTGMGGATADTVGRKLSEIATDLQVLCITHLPQIAARADRHFRVEKHVVEGRTQTQVARLDAKESVNELVRMMAGTDGTDAAEAFARELVDRARAERSLR